MSTGIELIPFLLIAGGGSLLDMIAGTASDVSYNALRSNTLGANAKLENLHLDDNTLEKLFSQEFETQIVNKRTLLKTLKEHGACNIEDKFNNISCTFEAFQIDFFYNGDKPYTMKISAKDNIGIDELVKDLGNEYAANAQEISYNKIKERLEKQNLSISDEEIYEDNTIVLTVDLD